MIGEAITRALVSFVIMTIIATAAITTALIFGIPWLWHVLKPWIHNITG